MMLVRLSGATSLRLTQWMSLPPLMRARFTEAVDHAPLPVVQKTKVQAIRTYAEALFPAPHLMGLLLELGAPRCGFRVLSEYITRRGDALTARTGVPFPRPIPTREQFDATWKSLTAPLALSPPPGRMCRSPIVGSLLAPAVLGTIRAIPAGTVPVY